VHPVSYFVGRGRSFEADRLPAVEEFSKKMEISLSGGDAAPYATPKLTECDIG
jgi:hypothetical protein